MSKKGWLEGRSWGRRRRLFLGHGKSAIEGVGEELMVWNLVYGKELGCLDGGCKFKKPRHIIWRRSSREHV